MLELNLMTLGNEAIAINRQANWRKSGNKNNQEGVDGPVKFKCLLINKVKKIGVLRKSQGF